MVPLTRWAIGASLALLSCFLSSLGLTLQRLSTLKEAEQLLLDGQSAPRKKCQQMWMLGVGIYIIASVPDVLSYVLVPQVVCSAVACFRLVIVTVMASMVLGEKLSMRQTLGMIGCTIGTFIVLCFGPVRMEKAAMINGFEHPQVKMYLAAGGAIICLLFVFDHLDSASSKCKLSARYRCFTLPLITGMAFAISKVFNTMIGFLTAPDMNSVLLHPRWIAMASGIALLGLTDFYLNLRATRLMTVQVFVPVSFVWCISLQYFQSVVLFGEFGDLPYFKAVLSIVGAGISLLGALCLQLPKPDDALQLQKTSDGVPNAPSQAGVDLECSIEKARILLES